MLDRAKLTLILLVLGLMTSGTGCHVLGIPSYRADVGEACGQPYCSDGFVSEAACPPGIAPPLPGWLAKWHAEKQLPDPPTYPRFHPLPTRPMFSPAADRPIVIAAPGMSAPQPGVDYGKLPANSQWSETNLRIGPTLAPTSAAPQAAASEPLPAPAGP